MESLKYDDEPTKQYPEAIQELKSKFPGEPFVGKAGQKLDGILKAMGVERKNTYITNIVKFRPAMPNQTTNNRQPTSEELAAFMPFIHEEIKVVAPKVIIALGGTAAQALLAKVMLAVLVQPLRVFRLVAPEGVAQEPQETMY